MEKQLQEIAEQLNKKGFFAHLAKDKDEAKNIVLELIKDANSIGMGGSVTLNEIGIFETLSKGERPLYNTAYAASKGENIEEAWQNGMTADVYLSSTNAITEDGDLINIDGNGNRCAAIFFGPKKVIFVAGKNKISSNPHTAVARIKKEACPKNAVRLGRKTPCAEGVCNDKLCTPPERMCNVTVRIQYPTKDREMHVVLVDEVLGY